jgi:hypothetical protein
LTVEEARLTVEAVADGIVAATGAGT